MSEAVPASANDLAAACVLCNHGCGVRVDVANGHIVAVRPDESSPISRGYICNKGFSIPGYVEHAQRLSQPLRRRPDGSFEAVSWDMALGDIAARLAAIREQHGGSAIGAVGLGGQANHLGAQYLVSLLAAMGSPRWFCAYAQEKTQHHLIEQWMFDAPPTQMFMSDAHHADFLLCIGSNPKVSNLMRNQRQALQRVGSGGPSRRGRPTRVRHREERRPPPAAPTRLRCLSVAGARGRNRATGPRGPRVHRTQHQRVRSRS